MKVLQFVYSLTSGGAERFVVDFSNELSRQGSEVVLCTLRDDSISNWGFYKNEISKNVLYHSLKIEDGFKLNNVALIYKYIKQEKPQIVHCHQNLVTYVFPLLYLFPRIKFYYTVHSDASKEVNSRIEYLLRKLFFSYSKLKTITISPENSRSYLKYYKISSSREIYNGRLFPEKSDSFQDVAKEIEQLKTNETTVFVHVGRCSLEKNQRMLINVFNRLTHNGNKVFLLIIGSGFDSEEGEKLKRLSCEQISFLGEKHNVTDYLFNADGFCLSSSYEGMPISLIEAFACGCTPICTPVGGMLNTIIHGETGYLSNSVSENDYYLAILTYLEKKDQIRGEDLKKYYSSHFSIEECTKKYLSLYEG